MTELSDITYQSRTYEAEILEDILGNVIGYDGYQAFEQTGQTSRLAVISANPRRIQGLLDAADDRGMDVEQINPVFFLRKFTDFSASKWDYVLICMDECGGTGTIFSNLRRFRERFPATPVVLISPDFGKDDLSCERLPLGDISLRFPLNENRADEALERAFLNNLSWQTRVNHLRGIEKDAIAMPAIIAGEAEC